jgi:hypothetical protein
MCFASRSGAATGASISKPSHVGQSAAASAAASASAAAAALGIRQRLQSSISSFYPPQVRPFFCQSKPFRFFFRILSVFRSSCSLKSRAQIAGTLTSHIKSMPASNRPSSAQVPVRLPPSNPMHHMQCHASHVTRHTSHVMSHFTRPPSRHSPHCPHQAASAAVRAPPSRSHTTLQPSVTFSHSPFHQPDAV